MKTTFPENAAVEEYWKKGKCPEYYRLQVLFYLAVMDLDEAYIACMWGFDEKKNYACVRIERNMEEEADLIERNVRFWNTYVIQGKSHRWNCPRNRRIRLQTCGRILVSCGSRIFHVLFSIRIIRWM